MFENLHIPFLHALCLKESLEPIESNTFSCSNKKLLNHIFFGQKDYAKSSGFPLPSLFPSYKYSVWRNTLLYESTLLNANSFLISRNIIPPNTNWIRNWRVNVSLSMWLYTVRIRAGINFMKDLGFRALVGVVQDHFDDLCWRIYIYIYLRYDLIDCVRPANSNRYGRGKYTEKEVIFDLISQWSGPVSPFSYDELMNCWHQSYILFLWTGGKVGAQREEDCTTRERRGQPVPKRQHGFWKCSCTLTSIQIKKYFHPRRSIFAR